MIYFKAFKSYKENNQIKILFIAKFKYNNIKKFVYKYIILKVNYKYY